jgi:hypothetical protein
MPFARHVERRAALLPVHFGHDRELVDGGPSRLNPPIRVRVF